VAFAPVGLSYRVLRPGEPPPVVDPEPLAILEPGDATHADPWLRKLAANAWFMEAERRRYRGRPDVAASYIHAAAIAPGSRTTNYNVAVKLLQENQLNDASIYALRAVAADPVRRGAYPLAIAILRRLGRAEEADAVQEQALGWARIP
jgi:Flp pilus assembly protein TadD